MDFVYEGLESKIAILKEKKIKNIDLYLLVSLERGYYEGDIFLSICRDIKNRLINNQNYIVSGNFKFKINSIKLDIGDVLNRHNLYYDLCEKYMLDHDLDNEKQIPLFMRNSFKERAYAKGKKQGKEWFKNNINAINQLIPKLDRLDENFQIKDKLTLLYEGDEECPRVEYVSHEYWLKHPRYKIVENALREICNLGDSVIDRSLKHDVGRFFNSSSKKKCLHDKELFIKQSYKYLFEETVVFTIANGDADNILELYINSEELSSSKAFRGKKARNNLAIKECLDDGLLKGANRRKFVTIRLNKQ